MNEIIIPINGSQQYYESVKNEVESLVKEVVKSTPFKDYSVKVEKNKIGSWDAKEEMELRFEMTKTIQEILTESYPNQIKDISITDSSQDLIIEVNTLLNEKEPTSIGKEIEAKTNKILKDQFTSNYLKERIVKIYIYNKFGERLNE